MRKIKRNEFLVEYLVIKNFPFARSFYERFYPKENLQLKGYSKYFPSYRKPWEPNFPFNQIPGGLEPVLGMIKDFVDTFKPYKSWHYVGRDIIQPLKGIGNIAKGLANIIGSILLFFSNTIRYALISGNYYHFKKNMFLNFNRTTSWLLDGISSLVRGITQVIATPLTWLIKIPLRGLITAIEGVRTLEEDPSIQRLVTEGKEAIQDSKIAQIDCIRHELHRKFIKAMDNGRSTSISSHIEQSKFQNQYFKYGTRYEYPLRADRKEAALQYLGIFSANVTERQESSQLKSIESCGDTLAPIHKEIY
tara:strand:- start:195669 stop:196586 length:918 start_codon:yes stop_codon:yes gene_type:complete